MRPAPGGTMIVVGTATQIVAGRFELRERIASGGEAVVYRAHDLSTDRDVALKLFHADSLVASRHLNEAALLRELDDPRIVGYVDHGVFGTRSYVATQWLSGETLAARLARGRLEPAVALRCAHGIATALAQIHARALVHRDIKPSNIVLREGDPDRPTLLDFGIALPPLAGGLRDTSARGTPSYVAPEQAAGRDDVDASADVFSLGCVLHACLTGAPPFQGDSAIAVLSKIVLAPAPRLEIEDPALPGLGSLMQRLLAKSPVARPRDGHEALELIDAALRGERIDPPAADARGTAIESALLSVVAMSTRTTGSGVSGHTETAPMTRTTPSVVTARVAADLVRLGGRAVEIPGLVLVLVIGGGGARRNAERAGRCALRLQTALPGARVAIATAGGVVALRWPVGPVIDDVLALLAATEGAAPGVYVDASTATFVGEAFELDERDGHRRLGVERPSSRRAQPTLVGRDAELAAIVQHARDAPDGAAFALVTGPPGIGKSRLAEEVVARLCDATPSLQVWSCACDPMRTGSPLGVVGGLVQAGLGLAADVKHGRARERAGARLAEITETSASSLGALLACLAAPPSPHESPPEVALGPAGFERALRNAWLAWIQAESKRGPVMLVIDDLQWCDPASLLFLTVLQRMSAGRTFVLGFTRPDLRERHQVRVPPPPHGLEIVLGPLDADARRALAADVLDVGEGTTDTARVEQVCLQSGGNPLALIELARTAERDPTSDAVELVPLMLARLELLAPAQRRALRVASVVGERFPLAWIQHATPPDGIATASSATVESLRALGMLHADGEAQYRFHHRTIRDAAYSLLGADDRVTLHGAAAVWIEDAAGDPTVVAEHWVAAHQPARAARAYLRSADRALADRAAAYRRAAELCAEALTAPALAVADRARLLRDRAHALDCAGVGVDAARAYLAAADDGGDDQLDLRRRAAEQFLRSGRVDDGIALIKHVMAALDIAYPTSQRAALAQLIRERLLLRLRGMRFRARSPEEIDPRAQLVVDVTHSVGGGLIFVDHIRALSLMARATRLALASGDARRVAHALFFDAGVTSPSDVVRAERIYARACAIAATLSDPGLDLLALAVPGAVAFSGGRFREGTDLLDRFEEARARSPVAGFWWESVTFRFGSLACRVMLGDIKDVDRRLPPQLQDAEARGDQHAIGVLSTGIVGLYWLAKDQPVETHRRGDAVLRTWPTDQFLWLHWAHLVATASADLYAGDAQRAYERLSKTWPAAVASQLMRARSYSVYLVDLRARVCIARGTPDALREARRWSAQTRRIGRHLAWARALAALHEAALVRADDQAAAWAHAASLCDASDLRAHAAAARCRRAESLEDPGARAAVLDDLRGLGVVAPERYVALLAPVATR